MTADSRPTSGFAACGRRGHEASRRCLARRPERPVATEATMITVSGLTKKYGDRTVVDDVSFTLEPGTVTGFLGPNGAGKTTTMRMMTGLVAPTAGSAVVEGKLYVELPNPGAVVGTLLDASAVHPGRTGRTHLRLLASAVGVEDSRVDEVLELVGLGDAG